MRGEEEERRGGEERRSYESHGLVGFGVIDGVPC
jgi:hypothetical protein